MTHWLFEGRSLLVTGATGGIGRAVAALFSAAGADVALVDQQAAQLSSLAVEMGANPGRIMTYPADVTSADACQKAVMGAAEQFGGLDYLVTSAGIYQSTPITGMTDEQWRRTLAVNLDGTFFTIRAALAHMRVGGSIVALASMAGHRGGSVGHTHYGASKGGVLAMVRGLARELGPALRVNAVSPGLVETFMTTTMTAERRADVIAQTPLARLGRAEEVAEAVAFLCSASASFITGETIHVNGGLHMD